MKELLKIYQLKVDSKYRRFLFREFNSWRQAGYVNPPREAYELVYEGPLTTSEPEELFAIFNQRPPEDFHGRSMSVSDVVEMSWPGATHTLYCDVIGFFEFYFA